MHRHDRLRPSTAADGGAPDRGPHDPVVLAAMKHVPHTSGTARFLLDLRAKQHPLLHQQLSKRRLQRYIGVIYRPEPEWHSHYLEASLPQQYEAFLWFDETLLVTPLQ